MIKQSWIVFCFDELSSCGEQLQQLLFTKRIEKINCFSHHRSPQSSICFPDASLTKTRYKLGSSGPKGTSSTMVLCGQLHIFEIKTLIHDEEKKVFTMKVSLLRSEKVANHQVKVWPTDICLLTSTTSVSKTMWKFQLLLLRVILAPCG